MTTTVPRPATAPSTPKRPSAVIKWFFRLPIALYRIGLAEQLGRSTLLLTTYGRKTGRLRKTALNYVVVDDAVYVVAGNGPRSDWLLNLQARPQVGLQLGRRCRSGRAELVADPVEQRRILELWAARGLQTAPPPAVQAVMRRMGFDYNASIRRHLTEDPPPPIVRFSELTPAG